MYVVIKISLDLVCSEKIFPKNSNVDQKVMSTLMRKNESDESLGLELLV